MQGLTQQVTPILNRVIYDYSLPAAALVSFFRLLACAWGNGYRSTTALDFDGQLVPLLGVKRSQVHEHLRLLRIARLVHWEIPNGRTYIFYFPPELLAESGIPDSGVMGVFNDILAVNINPLTHQQTTESGNPEQGTTGKAPPGLEREVGFSSTGLETHASCAAGPLPEDPYTREMQENIDNLAFSETMACLLKAGVWTDRALRIARKIASNEMRGHSYLPTRADVFGWTAYCFAFQGKNRLEQPVQVLSANLSANRRCPEQYRAPRICAVCCFAEGFCHCQEAADYQYPQRYLEQAFNPDYDPEYESSWGVCSYCHAAPCQCVFEEQEDELDEGDSESTAHI